MKNTDLGIVLGIILASAVMIGGLAVYFHDSQGGGTLNIGGMLSRGTTTTPSYSSPVVASTPCDQAQPISFVSAKVGTTEVYGTTYPALIMTWSNCSDQPIEFNVQEGNPNVIWDSYLNVTLLAYGQTSVVHGTLTYNSYGAPGNGGTVTVTVELDVTMSPNATIESVGGILTATDPVTTQEISVPANFTAY
jgi:hypothetical protein